MRTLPFSRLESLLMPIQIGQQLGQYEVTAQLGMGGMATVYKAYHAKLNRHVAIKVMHQAFKEDPTFLARFEREAQIVARLDHPNIVPVYDYDEFEGQPYLVMKFIQGRTLKNLLSAGPLPLNEIERIMNAVAIALTYAHEHGVLHRDIKPANIILDERGMPYLTDFGLARVAQSGESTLSTDMMLGTPHYISPEQAKGERDLDGRTDVYSLGVVLYELLVGRVPYTADTPYAVVHDHIYAPLPRPSEINPDIPAPVEQVLLKALAKNRDERYGTPAAMMDDFRRAVQTSTLQAADQQRMESAVIARRSVLPPAPARPVQSAAPPASAAPEKPKRDATPPLQAGDLLSNPARFADAALSRALQAIEDADGDSEALEQLEHARDRARRASQRAMRAEIEARERELAGEPSQGVRFEVDVTTKDDADDADDAGLQEFINSTPFDEESIRRRVEKRFKDRREFFQHVLMYVLINAGMWAAFGGPWNSSWLWFVTLGWGSGLAAHAVETLMNSARRDTAMEQVINEQMYNRYGEGWLDHASPDQYKRVRKTVRKDFDKRKEFFSHLVVYLCIIPMLGLFFGFEVFFVPLIAIGWGIGVAVHGMEALGTPLEKRRSHEAAVQREIELSRQLASQSYAAPKQKNKLKNDLLAEERDLRLTGDGEFTDSFIEEIDAERRARRSGE